MPRQRRKKEWANELAQAVYYVLERGRKNPLQQLLGDVYDPLESLIPKRPHMLPKQKNALRELVNAGCDEGLLLAGAFILSHHASALKIEMPVGFSQADRLGDSIKPLESLFKNSSFSPEVIFTDSWKAAWLRSIPSLLNEYRAGILKMRNRFIPFSRASRSRTIIAKKLATHIKSVTGRPHDEELCQIIEAFDGNLDTKALQMIRQPRKSKSNKTSP